MREPGKSPRGLKMRVFVLALAMAMLTAGAAASTAGAVPANFWGVVPQATPTPEQLQRLKGAGSTASGSRSSGARSSRPRADRSTGPASTA